MKKLKEKLKKAGAAVLAAIGNAIGQAKFGG
jgi:hypothetical protein